MNNVRIFLFANLRDYAGVKTVELEIPAGMTIAGLKIQLINSFPKLAPVRESMMAAINREYAADAEIVPQEAEIAFFPPVSGG